MIVELPKDADGREIPLDTKVLYDRNGFKNNVRSFMYVVSTGACNGTWRVRFTISTSLFDVSDMHIAEPDSWEKLKEDLSEISKGSVCHYFHKGGSNTCEGCPADGAGSCWPTMARDVTSRIRKLRGED